MIVVETFPVGPLQCNCSIIGCQTSGEAVVVDPGGDPEIIEEKLEKLGLKAKYLLHTHAHFDHVLGSRKMKESTGAKICLHKEDQWLYDNLDKQCQMFGFAPDKPLPVDHYLEDEESVQAGDIVARVLHTPGHTPGSLCYFMEGTKEGTEGDEPFLFAGDTLFSGSIGRTDLWGGSYEQIIKSISERLMVLEDETRVIPGHGPATSIWSEKKHNPYVKC